MHFTYSEPSFDQLRQGDLLAKTDALRKVLNEVHPHYAKPEYEYFQVLTQSCDLVRRGTRQECNSRYITIAAVRSLDEVITRAIHRRARESVALADDLYVSRFHEYDLKSLLRQILDNNHRDYFFLEAEPDYDLPYRCCTFLQLSISLRSYQHYDTCLDAKRLELAAPFHAKLGWLTGNLYSRVGTEDYAPAQGIKPQEFDRHLRETLSDYVVWIDQADFSQFRKIAEKSASFEEAERKMKERIEKQRDTRLSQLVTTIEKNISESLTDADKERLRNALAQDGLVKKIL